MLPPAMPHRLQIVYLTGVLELLGLLRFGFRSDETDRQVSRSDAGMFLTGQYLSYRLRRHGARPAYLLVGIPSQQIPIGWIYWTTKQNWFDKKASGM